MSERMDAEAVAKAEAEGDDPFFSEDRLSGHEGAIALPSDGYEHYRYELDDPLIARYRGQRYDDYARERTSPSFVQELLAAWDALYRAPFRGVTSDGELVDGLYRLEPGGASSPEPRLAAERVLELLDEEERARSRYPIDAPEWRAWSNPEFLVHRVGLRLEDLAPEKVAAILDLVDASLGEEGAARVRELMALNGFLGDLVGLPTIMNDRSYSVALFGEPSDEEPWGWQLFGHHVDVNFVAVGGRRVVAPVFLAAEPALPGEGRQGAFEAREALAIRLASSLDAGQRAAAVVYDSVLDPAMPDDRIHPADERHLAGAFQDNRVIPYEGVCAAGLDAEQRRLVLAIAEDFLLLLPDDQRRLTLAEVEAHLDETWFAWYGATDGSQPFYFRIQSPVVLAELDHHAGVWLNNRLPARFHVHTTLRLPNGNDYGRAYIRQWREQHGRPVDDPHWPARG